MGFAVGAEIGPPYIQWLELASGFRPEIKACGSPGRRRPAFGKQLTNVATYFVTAWADGGPDSRPPRPMPGLFEGRAGIADGASLEAPPPGVDDRDCIVGMNCDRDAVRGANRQRESWFAGEEDVTLSLNPGSRRLYHHFSVYLLGPGPLRRDIKFGGDAETCCHVGE